MNAVDQQRVDAIFRRVCECDPDERTDRLDAACAGDAALRARVEALLLHADDPAVDIEVMAGRLWERLAASAATEATPAPLPDRIGPYRVTRLLGEGGMGLVFLAEQARPRREVAVKIIRPIVALSDVARRFEHEAEILGRLRHPGIAQIYEAGVAAVEVGGMRSDAPFFAMEYIRGAPLVEHAETAGLDRDARVELLAMICDAVEHAHQRGVIHRDLKPSNILVEPADDGPGQPKILDFGIARTTFGPDGDAALTRADRPAFLGSLPYMSPEQAAGRSAEVDTRSDIYALGLIGFELLTGERARRVDERGRAAALEQIRSTPAPAMSSLDRRLRGDLDTIIARALALEPDRRYASATALADDLRRYLDGRPIAARRDSTLYVWQRQLRRYRWTVAAILTLLIGVAAFSLVTSRQAAANGRLARESRAYSSFFDQVLLSAEPEIAQGRDISVLRDMLAMAAARAEVELQDLPEVRASVQYTIGSVSMTLGLFPQAKAVFEDALSTRRERFGDGDPRVGEILISLGIVDAALVNRDVAESSFREAASIYRAHYGDDDLNTAHALSELAAFLLVELELDEGERLNDEAIAIYQRAGVDTGDDWATALTVRGRILDLRGEREAALATLEEAIRVKIAAHGRDSVQTASGLLLLGRTLRHQGRLAEAEANLRQGLALRRRLLEPTHTALAWPAIQLALTLTERGEYAEAETLAREAVEIYRVAIGEDNQQVIEAKADLARVLAAAGRNDEARVLYQAVLDWLRTAEGDVDRWLIDEYQAELEGLATGETPAWLRR